MGNIPSKELPGRSPQKLSKPRTAGLPTPGAPRSNSKAQPAATVVSSDPTSELISIPYSATANLTSVDEDQNGDSTPSSAKPFLAPPKAQRRLSLFRSKSSQEASDSRKSRRNTIIGSPALSFEGEGVSRAQSMSTHHHFDHPSQYGSANTTRRPPVMSRASWAYDMSYESQRTLSIVRDPSPPLPRSQTMVSLCAPSTGEFHTPVRRHTSVSAQPESAPISRANSEISLHPPMRRRSIIQTPGVATRTRPSPCTTRSRRSSVRYSHPATPSISRQSSFEMAEHRHLSFPPLPVPNRVDGDVPRVHTPREVDYTTTGAFKLGTLRITNGSPDLTPIIGSAPEYHAEKGRPPAISGADYFARAPACEIQDIKQPPCEESAIPAIKTTDVGKSDRNSMAGTGADVRCKPTLEFQTSLTDNRKSDPDSPQLQTQSKAAAIDDDLFEDDNQLDVSTDEILDIRFDSSARSLPPASTDPFRSGSHVVTRSDSGFVSNSKSESSQDRSSLTKADSGYSSNVSLRSIRKDSVVATPEKPTFRSSTESERDASNTWAMEVAKSRLNISGENSGADSSRSDEAPTPPPKDGLRMHPVRQASPSSTAGSTIRQQPAVTDTTRSNGTRSFELPRTTSTLASAKSEDPASPLSIANSTQKSGRLQRLMSLRSSTKQSFTVHEKHGIENKVPDVPKEIQDRLRQHTEMCAPRSRKLTLKPQISKETLKTILSVGSLEWAQDDEIRPKAISADETDEDDDARTIRDLDDVQDKSSKMTLNSVHSNFKSVAASMIANRMPIARKPLPISKDPPEPSVRGTSETGNESYAAGGGLSNYVSFVDDLVSDRNDTASRTQRPGHRPNRSRSVSTEEKHLPLRTYSLGTSHPSAPITKNEPASKTPERRDSPLERGKRSPPVSMVTQNCTRQPPPRCPSGPQGPAVLRSSSAGRPRDFSSGVQSPISSTSKPLVQRSSFGSYWTSAANSQLDLTSSARTDFIRESRASKSYGQSMIVPALKPQSSLDGFSRNQLRGMLSPTHRGQSPEAEASQLGNHQGETGGSDGRFHPSQLAWVPPYVPRGNHRRNLSAGQAGASHAPYRILHSYNSPAYRNAPIWG